MHSRDLPGRPVRLAGRPAAQSRGETSALRSNETDPCGKRPADGGLTSRLRDSQQARPAGPAVEHQSPPEIASPNEEAGQSMPAELTVILLTPVTRQLVKPADPNVASPWNSGERIVQTRVDRHHLCQPGSLTYSRHPDNRINAPVHVLLSSPPGRYADTHGRLPMPDRTAAPTSTFVLYAPDHLRSARPK